MVGATDGATGDGGAVKVATHGIIQTSGAGSTGLIVQSIGGGGGAAVAVDARGLVAEPIVEQANGAPAPRPMRRSFAAASVPQGAGSGGAVDVTIGAAIHTTGDQANGVIVQAFGGGGALGGSASGALAGAGTGGAPHLTVNADVTATGAGATAPVAQNPGGTGSAPILVEIGAVNAVGGPDGHALALDGGAATMLLGSGEQQSGEESSKRGRN